MKKESQDTGTTPRIKDAKRPVSIKSRFTRVGLIPSIALVVTWAIVAGYFVFTGVYTRQIAKSVQEVSIPALAGLSSLQKERSLSMAQLARSGSDQALRAQREQTDTNVTQMQKTAEQVMGLAPASIKSRLAALNDVLSQLPDVRRKIDDRTATAPEAFGSYNKMLDAASALFEAQARIVNRTDILQGAVAATEVFHVADLQSRAGSIITGAFAAGRLTRSDLEQFHTLVGAYHDELQKITPLRASVQQQFRQLVQGSYWADLSAAEQQLVQHGTWSGKVPNGLGVDAGQWQQASTKVNDVLLAMTTKQATEVAGAYLDDGNNSLLLAIAGSLLALLVVVAVWLAIRRSQRMVDGAVKAGLDAIAAESKTIAGTLPAALDRIGRGEQVDMASLLPDDGGGLHGQAVAVELGTIQEAVRQTSLTAIEAATGEAVARKNSRQNLVLAARRSQRWLSTLAVGLRDLENAEQDDPDKLEKVYALQHKITTLRGDNDNLIILGGGDLGRSRRTPEWIDDVLGAAKAQCEQFQRVRIEAGPKVKVAANAVLPISHLLAQLLNNAVAFSHPPTQVLMTSSPVASGLVVEIEDRGIGMSTEERERANALIREAPELVSSANVQKLGLLVVAAVARQFNVRVELKDSAYGGIKAIVLLRNDLLENTGEPTGAHRPLRSPSYPESAPRPEPVPWSGTPVRPEPVRRADPATRPAAPSWGETGSRTEPSRPELEPVSPPPAAQSWWHTPAAPAEPPAPEPFPRREPATPEPFPRRDTGAPEPFTPREPALHDDATRHNDVAPQDGSAPRAADPASRADLASRAEPADLASRAEPPSRPAMDPAELSDNTIQFPAIDPLAGRPDGTVVPTPAPRRPEPVGAETERAELGGEGADVSLPRRRSTVPGRSGAEHGVHRADAAEPGAPPRPRPYPTTPPAPRERHDEPAVPVLDDPAPGGEATAAGLPIRVRQASLAPGLRRPRVESREPAQAAPTHTADQARLRYAAFQQGMTRGRQANENSTDTVTENRNSDG